MEIGEKIKELRLKKGITQEELAEMIGVSFTQVSHYESGRRNPSLTALKKMAAIFGVSADEILGCGSVELKVCVERGLETLVEDLLHKIPNMNAAQLLILNEYAQRLLDKPQEQVIYSVDKDGKIDNVQFIRKED